MHVTSWRETDAGLMPGDFLDRMNGDMRARRAAGWHHTIVHSVNHVQVAEQDGQVIAFALAGASRDHPGFDAELTTLYALKTAQGQGTGRALLRATARAAWDAGARNLALWVLDVHPTRQWYTRQGGREAAHKVDGALTEVRIVWDDLRELL
ncbi:GNAT family N-acetyltransferase [Deinococcus sp.]|uniref:GNAT family N-acetyltransferase n=1 Tax=Deinococcus sp. TaxID=47478 RepID=UPI0028699247|nr:GNAT family N-acetyltransferase [Deinococcus sp.]